MGIEEGEKRGREHFLFLSYTAKTNVEPPAVTKTKKKKKKTNNYRDVLIVW
jgi:hypothetical protein